MQEDVRPWFQKVTNIGLIVSAVAGAISASLVAAGFVKAAIIVGGIATAGAAVAGLGGARRANAVREQAIEDQADVSELTRQWRKAATSLGLNDPDSGK